MILTSLSHFWSCLTLIFFSGGLWSYAVNGQTTKFDTSLQSETGFMGWYLGPSTSENTLHKKDFTLYTSFTNPVLIAEAMMDPETWTTSGSYAVGCDGTSCTFATDCNNNMISYDDGDSGSWWVTN